MKRWGNSPNVNDPAQFTLPGVLMRAGGDHPRGPAFKRLATPGEFALNRAKLRMAFPALLFLVFFAVVIGRLAELTLLHNRIEVQAQNQNEDSVASVDMSVASRADIVDRNGIVLATSLPTYMLCADTKQLLDPVEAENKLMDVLPELDRQKLSDDLRGTKRCAVIKRHLTPRQYYAVNKLGIAGLEFHSDESRIYPGGRVLAHIVGYTDTDNKGIAGLERTLNERLTKDFTPVRLSIDSRLQNILYNEISQAIANFSAIGGSGVVMDAQNGEILALVSLPDFDPQKPGEAEDDARFNRVTLGVYEMGSTFKIFNTALALDSGIVKAADRFDTTHPIKIGRKMIRDYHPSKYDLNVPEIMMESSNIGAARMVERVGAVRQREFLADLGLFDKSPIELPEVGQPLYPSLKNWGEATMLTAAFGHGIAVNALQLTSGVAALIGGGKLLPPTLFAGGADFMQGPDKVQYKTAGSRLAVDTLIKTKTAAQLRAMMRLVVTDGTAKAAEVPGYFVIGKTGTADKAAGGKYEKNARLSSFVGAFPGNAPRYVVFVMLDDPKGNAKTFGFATGGWVAAPVVGHVINQIGPLLGVLPVDKELRERVEAQILRPLGAPLLGALHLKDGSVDYASVESNLAE